ncbi:MFS transporter [Inquilinus sp.]|uniref:MFS transporter n=1 Tax=Inquilinus sp. TaxID=1932117 RepID=UPI0031E06205
MVLPQDMGSGRRRELAAGWPVLVAATLGCAMGASSLPFYSLGSFIAPLQQEFGWARGDITTAFLCLTLVLAVIAPGLGWLIDRFGPRAVALAAIPGFALTLYLLSRFDGTLAGFYLCFGLAALLGGGTTPILYTRAVNGRFDAARGLALGLTLAGMGVMAIALPPLLAVVIGDHGWRAGYLMLAGFALLPWPFVLASLGGRRAAGPVAAAEAWGVERGVALRSRIFWTIAVGFCAIAIAVSALTVHMVPLLRDAGMDPLRAAGVASLTGFGVLLGRLVIGWLIDQFFAPRVAAAIFGLTAIGCLLLAYGGFGLAPLAAFLIGFSLGAEVDLISYLTARYFGMRRYGFLYATIYAFFAVGAAIGPLVAGRIYDATGGYGAAIWTVVACLVGGALAALSLPRFDALRPAAAGTMPQTPDPHGGPAAAVLR